jgi:hypothetical protein
MAERVEQERKLSMQDQRVLALVQQTASPRARAHARAHTRARAHTHTTVADAAPCQVSKVEAEMERSRAVEHMLESAVGAAAPSPDRSVRRRSQCAFYTLHRTSHTLQPWRVRTHGSMAPVIEPLSSHFMARPRAVLDRRYAHASPVAG